uniref:HUWE1 associated protein modifying stress responses n=1 Tax=Sarcophilus harrisii TaxID=9305 RepID=A0A7N4NPT1_SARHA
ELPLLSSPKWRSTAPGWGEAGSGPGFRGRCCAPGRELSGGPGGEGKSLLGFLGPPGLVCLLLLGRCEKLPGVSDRVCQQQGLSLWVPFQNAATAVTNLYKESVDAHQRSFDLGIQIGYQRRNKDVLAWVKKRRRTIRREDLISFLCGKVPPPRNSRAPPRLTVVSPNRATSTETSSSVETDLQPFREAIALHGLSGAMASISVRSSTPGSPTHVSSGSNASRRRNGLHDMDLNTFISEEMALHLDNGGTRKRTSAQCGDVITDSPTHKRNRMI